MRPFLLFYLCVFVQRHNCTNRAERTPSPSPGEGRGGVGFVNDAADGNGRIQEQLAEDFLRMQEEDGYHEA